MFEDVEQLEKEVKDFRKNILASSELINGIESLIAASKAQSETFVASSAELLTKMDASTATLLQSHDEVLLKQVDENRALLSGLTTQGESLLAEMNKIPPVVDKRSAALISEIQKDIESLITASKAQSETFVASSAELLTKMDASTDALQKSHGEVLLKQIEENRALLSGLTTQGESLLAEMNKIPPVVDKRSAALISEIQKDTEQLQNMTKSVIEQLRVETEAIKISCDESLKSMKESNKEHIPELTAALEVALQPYLRRLEEADASIKHCEAQLSQQYGDFLVRLESTNVDQMVKICQEIKKSMDTKLLFLTIGVGASVILMLVLLFR